MSPLDVYPRPPAEERFWRFVDKTDTCWHWTGSLFPTGYGQFSNKVSRFARRYAYTLLVGPIPDGLFIDHLCRVRDCVNPAHMEVVTHRENTLRGVGPAAVHAAKTHCIHGHPFDEGNTWVAKDGSRHCRTCHRITEKRRRKEHGDAVRAAR